MSVEIAPRTLPWDWYQGIVPENVALDPSAYVETTYSFLHFRSNRPDAMRIGEGTIIYLSTMFDVGPQGRVNIGQNSMLTAAWIICDAEISLGDFALISWNVVLMDTYRAPLDLPLRRRELQAVSLAKGRDLTSSEPGRPIRIDRNVWLGFDCCVLPGVTIGEGSIVGARSVVMDDVPPYTIVAGNPARVIRQIEPEENPTFSAQSRNA